MMKEERVLFARPKDPWATRSAIFYSVNKWFPGATGGGEKVNQEGPFVRTKQTPLFWGGVQEAMTREARACWGEG